MYPSFLFQILIEFSCSGLVIIVILLVFLLKRDRLFSILRFFTVRKLVVLALLFGKMYSCCLENLNHNNSLLHFI